MSDSDPDNDIPKAVGLQRKSKALSETALNDMMNPKAQTPSNSQKSNKSKKSPNSEKSKKRASQVFRNESDSDSESEKAHSESSSEEEEEKEANSDSDDDDDGEDGDSVVHGSDEDNDE